VRPKLKTILFITSFAQGKPVQGKVEDMRLLLRGMAATFNSQAAGDLKATVQFEVTGKQAGDRFLSIEKGKCTYQEGKASSPGLTIKTLRKSGLPLPTKRWTASRLLWRVNTQRRGI